MMIRYMKKYLLALALVVSGLSLYGQEDSLYLKLTLQDVIELSRDQSPMATMARHQFRRDYWEYRSYKASFLPSLTLNAEIPDLNRTIENVIQPDGSEIFVDRAIMNSSLDARLSQNVSFTGGNIF